MVQGAAAGRYTVKSCGKAHAWCRVCQPQQINRLRKPKLPRKAYDRPCRNCGSCDTCLGLTAPDGMKVCRKCRETKPVDQFPKGGKNRGVRNQCRTCTNKKYESCLCTNCSRRFWRNIGSTVTNCHDCRPLVDRGCKACGKTFVGTQTQKKYCSAKCRDDFRKRQRSELHRTQRTEALAHYSNGTPRCVCCDETEPLFLALDHIDGGGNQQRKSAGGGGFWVWLRTNGYPSGFRVLCHNCNHGRHINGGSCPHEHN